MTSPTGIDNLEPAGSMHKLAKGVDIELWRNPMNHESRKTTQIYLHTTKGRLLGDTAPFDDPDR